MSWQRFGTASAGMLLALVCVAHGADTAPVPPLRTRPLTWAQPVLGIELGNCYQISPTVYRSEQPNAADLVALERRGFSAVLNLREYHSDTEHAAATTLTLHRVPMAAGNIEPDKLRQALTILRAAKQPILVHCWHGSDRTGLVIAMYRMVEQSWSRSDAIDEFRHGGFGYHESWFPNLIDFLETVDVEAYRRDTAPAAKP